MTRVYAAAAAMIRAATLKPGIRTLHTEALELLIGQLEAPAPLATLFQAIGPDALAAAREAFVPLLGQGRGLRETGARLAGRDPPAHLQLELPWELPDLLRHV